MCSKGRFLFKHRLNVDQVPLPFVVGDYDHTIDDKGTKDVWNGTLIPWLKEHIPNDEAVIFADNLDAQIQPAYLENQKEKGNVMGWSLLKGGTHWSQPVDQGAGREVKRDIDYEQNEWLEDLGNLDKWENAEITASDRRILMTWWSGEGYAWMVKRCNLNRYFEKTDCLMSVSGSGDDRITPEGLSSFTFERQVIPAVLAETPLQTHVPAATHVEMQHSVQQEELSEEEVDSEDDDDSDEAEKWFVPEGFATVDTPVEAVDSSFVGAHIMFKWNGVGWCHGWVQKFYPNHRRGYNVEVVYEDVDRRDHILRLQDYGRGDTVEAGAWCLLQKQSMGA
ncbi:hypothetical protein CYMTET_26201 [Cymbomonas tetramitiformis]|uniref:Uncharacterized protein n=1 Tax=Cymbomonas tetramitiformis TaxID=36881 RepID=A0AAE0KY59_9CHLO|nr:hypothetical protein CYMTET_26201 [Cymbomonas tetramitiformis]